MEAQHYPFSVPALPYPYDALSPHIDEQTLHFHHDKHLTTYVDNLNALLKDYPRYHGWSLAQLILGAWSLPMPIRTGVLNNAGGVYNHTFYFEGMTPNAYPAAQGELAAAIDFQFGGLDGMYARFKEGALKRFGSGWMWLAADAKGRLHLLSTANQDTLFPMHLHPLLLCDVWEHAYYLQYQNRRGDAVEQWFHLIHWERANALYRHALRKRR